ncbi:DoxX family membrane protein [Terrimonas sp. NA20]|uniref:DoxX family membrane protein n=1 Tax=Terrimonas ginsenosidimutans TaxID=2908004 RepID=A0ABS9KLN2_9BACT|nr:MauE/DoxX family redox-associated membrane protein [Terrimonas ginsenosidimutans]MCG2613240.1 DoxX family membrane protein [Terrimonas ginsenosidimutans]
MTNFKSTFFFLRLPIAVSMLGHGLVRLPKLAGFSQWMRESMQKSVLPDSIITPFSYALPFAEAIIGVLLLIGVFFRYTIYAGLLLMSVLILGSASIENWGAIEAQLIHAICFGALLWWHDKYKPAERTSMR